MRSKAITGVLLGITLVIFLSYFLVMLNYNRSMSQVFKDIEISIVDKNWSQAERSMEELDSLWSKLKYLTMLDYSEQDFANFSDTIVRLKAAVKTQDESNALGEVMVSKRYWSNFMKVVPEP